MLDLFLQDSVFRRNTPTTNNHKTRQNLSKLSSSDGELKVSISKNNLQIANNQLQLLQILGLQARCNLQILS